MVQKLNDETTIKDKVSSLNIKRILRRIISPKQKINKYEVSDDCGRLEIDAVPGNAKSEDDSSAEPLPNAEGVDTSNQGDSDKERKSDEKPKHTLLSDEDSSKNENESNIPSSNERPNRSHHRRHNMRKRDHVAVYETNITVTGCGTGVHVGNTYIKNTNTNNFGPGNPFQQKQAPVKKMKKTEAIEALMKCEDELENSSLDILSRHFGKEWMEIGRTLNLTRGELDHIEEQYKGCIERSYQMLLMWGQHNYGATLGQLCEALWNGKIEAAREAVQQLSFVQ